MTYSLGGKDAGGGELDLFFVAGRLGVLIFWRLSLAACRSVAFQVLILSLQSFEH